MSNYSAGAKSASTLEKIPFLSFYARTRGEAFVLSWFHRIAGIAVVIFTLMHLMTSFTTPALFGSQVGLIVLSIFLIYHSLNGGRLILYEVFGVRNDESLIRWVWGLSLLYILFMALLMVIGNQEVSSVFFWSVVFVSSLILCFGVASRVWQTEHTAVWKLQRITGAFLLMLVPAHIVFMHLSASVAHPAPAVIQRMQEIFIRIVDVTLLLAILYHGGYGVISVLGDYVASRALRIGAALVITVVMVACAAYRLF